MVVEPGGLLPVAEPDWRSGFRNLLRLENSLWWSTRRWWVHLIVVGLLLNSLLAYGIWIVPLSEPLEQVSGFLAVTLDVILFWMSILSVFATLFVGQNALIGDVQSGVAAWILSAPVSRAALILARFFGNAIGLLAVTIWLQGGLIYLQISLFETRVVPFMPLAAALALQSLYVLFYLALVLMLGSFTSSRAVVLGGSFAVLIAQPFIDRAVEKGVPWLSWALPAKLPELARFAHRWEPLPTWSAVVATLVLVGVFLGLAIWRFRREEF